jgi:hypothetical protein
VIVNKLRQQAWHAINAINDFCPVCARPLSVEAESLGTGTTEQWISIRDRAYEEYRRIVLAMSRGEELHPGGPKERILINVSHR